MKAYRKKAPPASPAWHPDFRDQTTLPDVKVVRTSFFINGISALILVGAAVYLVIQEVKRYALQGEVQALEERIEENRTRNEEVLKQHRAFQKEERYLNELTTHLDGSLELSEFLRALGDTLHPRMILSTIRYQDVSDRGRSLGKELLLNGSVRANPDAAATVVTDYLNVFQQDPVLATTVAEATPTSLVPTPEGDHMAFGIALKIQLGTKEDQKEEKN